MHLSDPGKIVEECWVRIPEHFPNTRVDVFQIMPNHVHGIVRIREANTNLPPREDPVGLEFIQPLPKDRNMGKCATLTTANLGRGVNNQTRGTEIHSTTMNLRRGEVPSPSKSKGDETSPLPKIVLGNMIAYFKYQATKRISELRGSPGRKVFQRDYFDHIIRDDVDHFFHERYIELNPLMWDLDSENPSWHAMSTEDLRKYLKERFDLEGMAVDRIVEHEISRCIV
jgi:hypothetical protein